MSSSTAAAAAAATTPPYEVEECRGVLRVFSDGSIVRASKPGFNVPIRDDGSVLWKDALFEPANDLYLRLYKPAARLPSDPPKFPVFYYYHGGGYCIGSRTWPNCQNYCLRLASELRAVIIAPDYRLAPEHRLPAAIEDGVSALTWLRAQALSSDPDTWLTEAADFGRVFVSGDSAGGNIAHHLAVRFDAGSGRDELAPVRVRGYVQLMPFYGGDQHSRSEAECPVDAFLNLELNDRYWRLSLPRGETRDHPLVNPFGPASPSLERVEIEPVLVVVGELDLLRDRAVDYAERLKGWGKPVEVVECKGQQHGFFTISPTSEAADELMRVIKRFMKENGGESD